MIFTGPPSGCVHTREIALDHGLSLAVITEHDIGHFHARVRRLLSADTDAAGVTPNIEETLDRSSDRRLVGSALPYHLSQADAFPTKSRKY